ncbi:hypothetical protein B0H17DRAFT_1212926 [Mycena rosella]|uniref:Uncharacterized protein n=1 Tax=Mycena rosella TaxID=1033263 RepID=A0AAD7G5Q8_MYCRO|nr:hypothetical protein B0H17DRAFT_1212926 [Mycena rosella]
MKICANRVVACVGLGRAEGLIKFSGKDLYWDNVGGEIVEGAIEYLRLHACLIMCGSISEYTVALEARYGIKKRLRIEGFLVPDLARGFSVLR